MFREQEGTMNISRRPGIIFALAVNLWLWVCIIALARWVWIVTRG